MFAHHPERHVFRLVGDAINIQRKRNFCAIRLLLACSGLLQEIELDDFPWPAKRARKIDAMIQILSTAKAWDLVCAPF